MPRFFFHTHDGVDAPDETGTDLPNVEAAKAHAMQIAARYAAAPAAGANGGAIVVDVRDDRGSPVCTARLVAAFDDA